MTKGSASCPGAELLPMPTLGVGAVTVHLAGNIISGTAGRSRAISGRWPRSSSFGRPAGRQGG